MILPWRSNRLLCQFGGWRYVVNMNKRERDALFHFAAHGPCQMPAGAGVTTRSNLLARKWIVRTERLEDYGPEIYAMTVDGFNALEKDRLEQDGR